MKFESEWRGLGPRGKDLMPDDELMDLGGDSAKITRLFMLNLEPGKELWLKEVEGAVREALGELTETRIRTQRLKAQNVLGLLRTRKEEDGRKWLIYPTERGVDFINWLIHDKEDGSRWGLKNKVDLSAEEKRRYEQAFVEGNRAAYREAQDEGGAGGGLAEIKKGVVQWKLGKWGLVLDDRIPRSVWGKIMSAVHKEGFRTVFVPDGYEVVVLEVSEDERGKAKKKAHRVVRWSEFPITDRKLIMESGTEGDDSVVDTDGERDE